MLLEYNNGVIFNIYYFMKTSGEYYAKATQSVFIVAGILMLFSFPYFFKQFEPLTMAILVIVVAMAILAGLASAGNSLTKKLSVAVSILAFIISSYRAVTLFFGGIEEPVMIFSFWVLQILSLLFFLAIYFSIRANHK